MVSVKILLLEDDPDDVEVITRTLAKSNFFSAVIKVADKQDDFSHFLSSFEPEIILSDYRLPQFSGLDALKICLEKTPEIPFIFVTGAIGEELAAETVLNGAWGFILKSGLDKLNPVINNCLLLSRQSSLPERISSLISTSNRVRRQIEHNNIILDKARDVVSREDDKIKEDKGLIRKDLEKSQREIQKLIRELKTNEDES